MKKQSTTLFTQLSKETFNSLTREVKETLAPVFKTTPKKTFTAADLWNIQRQGKAMVQRRFLF